MTAEQESAIEYIVVKLDDAGEGFYVAMYGNNEKGPKSEGYTGDERLVDDDARRRAALEAAREAAARDFPDLAAKPNGIRVQGADGR